MVLNGFKLPLKNLIEVVFFSFCVVQSLNATFKSLRNRQLTFSVNLEENKMAKCNKRYTRPILMNNLLLYALITPGDNPLKEILS